jgi:porphobilinogen deaminase
MKPFVLGTRGSDLALAQTRHVAAQLRATDSAPAIEERVIRTSGDDRLDVSLGAPGPLDKGLFTKELEDALLAGRIDAAVHSLKDLPVDQPPGVCLGAILERENPADVLISKYPGGLDALDDGMTVATSSVRRQRFLQWHRPGLRVVGIRGNVPTRIRKLLDSEEIAAIVLAGAGLRRLEAIGCELHLDRCHLSVLDFMLPAPGQGAIAVECRTEDDAALSLLAEIDHIDTATCVAAERAVLGGLGGGCHLPLGARGTITDCQLHLQAAWFRDDRTEPVFSETRRIASEWMEAAADLVRQLRGE